MYKNYLFNIGIIPIIISLIVSFSDSNYTPSQPEEDYVSVTDRFENYIDEFYTSCDLDGKIDFEAFRYALIGYFNLDCDGKLKRNDLITIIDYTRSSNEKRLFVIDVVKKELVLSSLVAHGKNTGDEYAKYFSNTARSQKSSIGFFTTAETYDGRHEYSLKIDGLEYTNSNVRSRGVVFHGADYVDETYTVHSGRIGRSNGCPALPQKDNARIVDTIKGGSCLFIYFPDEKYLKRSSFLNFETAMQQFNASTENLSSL